MKRVEGPSYPVSIFIAGDETAAREHCRAFCDAVGLCVTVTPTTYVYTDGEGTGVIVGLINYQRFPADPAIIFERAEHLAVLLIRKLGQESASIQAPDKTVWISFRTEDEAAA